MLALPFDLMFLVKQPGYAVLIAAFGPLPVLLFFGTFLRVRFTKWLAAVCAGTMAITWFPGFGMAVLMYFCGIGGAKILLCWVVMLLGVLVFVVTHHRQLAVVLDEYGSEDPSPPRKRTRKR